MALSSIETPQVFPENRIFFDTGKLPPIIERGLAWGRLEGLIVDGALTDNEKALIGILCENWTVDNEVLPAYELYPPAIHAITEAIITLRDFNMLYANEELSNIVISKLLELRDHSYDTFWHTTLVAAWAKDIVNYLNQQEGFHVPYLNERETHLAGLLHDIGKLNVPEYVLNKASRLTRGEDLLLKEPHVLSGVRDIANMGLLLSEDLDDFRIRSLVNVIRMVHQHHELYDGSGYPGTLASSEIGQSSWPIIIADRINVIEKATISRRPYQNGEKGGLEYAFGVINQIFGNELDPKWSTWVRQYAKERLNIEIQPTGDTQLRRKRYGSGTLG